MGLFDLEGALGFYGAYHNNRINQLIHVIFVPCIVWSAMVVFNYLSLDIVLGHHVYLFGSKAAVSHPWLQLINDNIVIGGGAVLFLLLAIYYLTLTRFPAVTYDMILFGMLLSSGYFFQHVTHAWTYALALHVFAWYMQIHPGHGIFEKRAAALTDNFFGGLALGHCSPGTRCCSHSDGTRSSELACRLSLIRELRSGRRVRAVARRSRDSNVGGCEKR